MSLRPETTFDFDAGDFSTYLNKIIHEWSKTVVILVFVLVPVFSILDYFAVWGAPGTYNKATGAFGGVIWKTPYKLGGGKFSVTANYVAPEGNLGGVRTEDNDPVEGARVDAAGAWGGLVAGAVLPWMALRQRFGIIFGSQPNFVGLPAFCPVYSNT